jgi:transcriptional regulator with XRE-family HTH domain
MTTSRKPDESDKAKGRELAQLRKAAGMSQERLAIKLGVSAKQLGKYERGQNRIPIGRYETALKILRVQRPATGGFAESQAPYDGPNPEKDALLLALDRAQREVLKHLKLCFEIAGRM